MFASARKEPLPHLIGRQTMVTIVVPPSKNLKTIVTMPTLIVFAGLSGSGKSAIAGALTRMPAPSGCDRLDRAGDPAIRRRAGFVGRPGYCTAYAWAVTDYISALLSSGCRLARVGKSGDAREEWEAAPVAGLPATPLLVGEREAEVRRRP
jgi:hypothetical protein